MPNLNVSYQEMQQEASALHAEREQVAQQLAALRARIDKFVATGFVTDSASGAFGQSYQSFVRGSAEVVDALDAIARLLTAAAQTFQDADQALGQQFGS